MIREISEKQRLALLRLVRGEGVDEAAWAAKVDLGTIFRWIREDEVFKRELHDARRAACISARAILLKALPAALALVKKALQDGNMDISMSITRRYKLLARLETVEAELAPADVMAAMPCEGWEDSEMVNGEW